MRIGLALPQYEWETVEAWAKHADGLGFDSLWVRNAPADPGNGLDPLAQLAALARVTTRARLGPLVLNAALRPPSVTAKALATIDVLSGGRLVIGMGAGRHEPELIAAKVPFLPRRDRLRQLRESLDILRGMFTGGPFTYRGRHWTVDAARCLPRPVQRPHPPLWVGGKGDALLRLAARHADGWNTVWAWTPEAYGQRLAVLHAECERIGRDPATVARSLGLSTLVGADEADLRRRFDRLRSVSPPGALGTATFEEWRRSRLVGTPEQVREQVERWAALGVEELIVEAGAVPSAVADLDDVSLIAEACRLG